GRVETPKGHQRGPAGEEAAEQPRPVLGGEGVLAGELAGQPERGGGALQPLSGGAVEGGDVVGQRRGGARQVLRLQGLEGPLVAPDQASVGNDQRNQGGQNEPTRQENEEANPTPRGAPGHGDPIIPGSSERHARRGFQPLLRRD